MFRDRRPVLFAAAILAAALLCLVAVSSGRIALFYVNVFSPFSIDASLVHGSVFRPVTAREFKASSKNSGFSFYSDLAVFEIKWLETLGTRKFVVLCELKDVVFYGEKPSPVTVSSADGLFLLPFRSNWKYGTISMTLVKDFFSVAARNVEALSDAARLSGSVSYNEALGDVRGDMHVSFSPLAGEFLTDEVRKVFLVEENNGWWGSDMVIGGNVRKRSVSVKGDLIEINVRPVRS